MPNYQKIKIPGFREKHIFSRSDKDIIEVLEDTLEDWVLLPFLYSGKLINDEYRLDVDSLDNSFLEKVISGEKQEKKSWDKFIAPVLGLMGRSKDPEKYLKARDFVKNSKGFVRIPKEYKDTMFQANSEKLRKNKNKIEDILKSYGSDFVDLSNLRSMSKRETDELLNNLEDKYQDLIDNVRKRAGVSDEDGMQKSKLIDLAIAENIEDVIYEILRYQRSGEADKVSIPVKVSAKGIRGDQGGVIPDEYSNWYTNIVNVPKGELDEPDLEKTIKNYYLKDEDFYPTGVQQKKSLGGFLDVAEEQGKDVEVEVLDDNSLTDQEVYLLNLKEKEGYEPSIMQYAKSKYPNNAKGTNPAVYLKSISDFFVERSDELSRVGKLYRDLEYDIDDFSSGDPLKYIKYVYDKVEDIRDFKSSKGEVEANKEINILKNLRLFYNREKESKTERSNPVYKYFRYDPKQKKVRRSPERGGTDGIRYEHVVPMKVMGEILLAVYEGFLKKHSDDIDSKGNLSADKRNEFKKIAEEIIEVLYTIAWIDIDEDVNLSSGGYQADIDDGVFDKLVDAAESGDLNKNNISELQELIFDRYVRGAVIDNKIDGSTSPLKKLKDVTKISDIKDDITLKATLQDLLPPNITEDIDVEKNISLLLKNIIKNPEYGQEILNRHYNAVDGIPGDRTLRKDPRISRIPAKINAKDLQGDLKPKQEFKKQDIINILDKKIKDREKALEDPEWSGARKALAGLPREMIDSLFYDILDDKIQDPNLENIYISPNIEKMFSQNQNTIQRESKTPKLTSLIFGYYG